MRLFTFMLLLLAGLYSCDKTHVNIDCGEAITVDSLLAQNGPFDSGTKVTEAIWNGSCLELIFGYSGCSGDHDIQFVTNGAIAKSDPPQIEFVAIHNNQELCDAAFSDQIDLNIDELQVYKESESFIINFNNTEYSYLLTK